MKNAVITGASSGIGLAIAKIFLNRGYRVYGLGRDFAAADVESEYFNPINVDLTHTQNMVNAVNEIKEKVEIHALVNCAGVGYFGPHEEINHKKIHEMVAVNLEAPMIITQLLLRDLKRHKGLVINISSAAAKGASVYGCAYGAVKAGLSHFSNSLFEEVRKYGVKVIAIHPDITKTNFYRNADFTQADGDGVYLEVMDVAKAVEYALNAPEGSVITDITIKPQVNKIQRKNKGPKGE